MSSDRLRRRIRGMLGSGACLAMLSGVAACDRADSDVAVGRAGSAPPALTCALPVLRASPHVREARSLVDGFLAATITIPDAVPGPHGETLIEVGYVASGDGGRLALLNSRTGELSAEENRHVSGVMRALQVALRARCPKS